MKIRAQSGKVIDLQEFKHTAFKVGSNETLAVIIALEAALGVQVSTPATNDWQYGWNACMGNVRYAAGVIEEPADG